MVRVEIGPAAGWTQPGAGRSGVWMRREGRESPDEPRKEVETWKAVRLLAFLAGRYAGRPCVTGVQAGL